MYLVSKVTISSLDDLAKQTDTKYSVVKGSDTETYFKHMAKIEETFYNNWKTMSLGSTSPNTADKSSQYAVWDYPLGDKFTIIWNRMKETGLLNSSAEGVQKVSNFLPFVSFTISASQWFNGLRSLDQMGVSLFHQEDKWSHNLLNFLSERCVINHGKGSFAPRLCKQL